LDPDRLYVTYYGGDPQQPNVPADLEARDIWRKKGLPDSRILPFNMKDNFWEMGDTGPCGPCTEIHYDRIGGRDASSLVNMDDPDVLEIWNNVFMQFNRENDGSLSPLPAPSVDTGMGLERVTSVLIDARSNYDTDLFQKIFKEIQKETGARPYTGKVGKEDADLVDTAYRVIADHIRTLTIALTDGAVPSNAGRGYVLRLILRRAVRFGRDKLNAPSGFFHKLVPAVLDTLGEAFPELKSRPEDVTAMIAEEEAQFGKTLDQGIKKFKKFAESGSIGGKEAFLLSTSFGFPVDLTQSMAEELGLQVDVKAYEGAMEDFRQSSKKNTSNRGKIDMTFKAAQVDNVKKKNVGATNDDLKYDWDSTGDGKEFEVKIVALYDGKEFIDEATGDVPVVGVVLDKTPCYAEQGGQTFDIADITTSSGAEFKVFDTQKYAGYVVHCGCVQVGTLMAGDSAKIKVDYVRRSLVAKNHTATHILNYALREVLGDKVDQKGSFVDEFKLRFDFSHGQAVSEDELAKVEKICNDEIQKKLLVSYQEVALGQAQAIGGLRAVFGETYPDPVRVVSVGPKMSDLLSSPDKLTGNKLWGRTASIEFCGGTHVSNSSEIYKLVLISEEGIAKGIRRIVAVTSGQAAVEASLKSQKFIVDVDEARVFSGALLDSKIATLRHDLQAEKEMGLVVRRDLLKQIDNLKGANMKDAKKAAKDSEKKAREEGERLATEAAAATGKTFVGVVDAGGGDDAKNLGYALDVFSKKCTDKAVCFLSNSGGKLAVLTSSPEALQQELSAKAWFDKIAAVVGAKGGGKADKAQGQCAEASKFDEALKAAKSFP